MYIFTPPSWPEVLYILFNMVSSVLVQCLLVESRDPVEGQRVEG